MRKRIAFVTDEYPLTLTDAGGLASYVQRMAQLLAALDHQVEVFVSDRRSFVDEDGPVLVHHVGPAAGGFALAGRWLGRHRRLRSAGAPWVAAQLDISLGMAGAVSRRERELEFERGRGFDFVQSCDLWFRGLFISRAGRPHIIRCSWARDLFQRVDGVSHNPPNAIFAWLERLAIRRATAAYAPSEYVSRYYRERFRLDVGVVRPPFGGLVQEAARPDFLLPPRFLLHFGQVCRRKGSDVLAEALPIAWELEPELMMVWAGKDVEGRLPGFQRDWGSRADNVIAPGAVPRSQLITLIKQAAASVLPSRCDNLPNTAIESLAAGVPVIGTQNSSIDELVVHEANGLLVPQEDPAALAAAMVRLWRFDLVPDARALPKGPTLARMAPDAAAAALLFFAASVASR